MSKRSHPSKGAKEEYESDGGFVEDAPKGKKQKKDVSTEMQKDDDGNPFWELSGKRRVQVTEFKGTTMIGVREFYEKDGKSLPGKKGVSMSVDQWKTLVGLLPEIERVLVSKGIEVRRPQYDSSLGGAVKEEGIEEEESTKGNGKRGKPNHEATSDEDEG